MQQSPLEKQNNSPRLSKARIREQDLTRALMAVEEFHRAFDVQTYKNWTQASFGACVQRANLINEELTELINSTSSIEELDARCDLMYVALGALDVLGISANTLSQADAAGDYVNRFARVVQKLNQRPPCWRTILWNLPDAILGLAAHSLEKFPRYWDAYAAVHDSNMTKLWPLDLEIDDTIQTEKQVGGGMKLVNRKADGKIIKPPTFSPPDLRPYLF